MTTTYFTFQTTLTTTWEDRSQKEVQLVHSVYLSKNIAIRFMEDASTPDDFIALKQAVEAAKRTVYTSQNLHFKNAELSDQIEQIKVASELIEDSHLDLNRFKSQHQPSEDVLHFVPEGEKFLCESGD